MLEYNELIKKADDTFTNASYLISNILNVFRQKPINVAQIGCLPNLTIDRDVYVWPELFFAKYINKFGGQALIYDNQKQYVKNTELIYKSFNVKCCGYHDEYDIYEHVTDIDLIYFNSHITDNKYMNNFLNNIKILDIPAIIIDRYFLRQPIENKHFIYTVSKHCNGFALYLHQEKIGTRYHADR